MQKWNIKLKLFVESSWTCDSFITSGVYKNQEELLKYFPDFNDGLMNNGKGQYALLYVEYMQRPVYRSYSSDYTQVKAYISFTTEEVHHSNMSSKKIIDWFQYNNSVDFSYSDYDRGRVFNTRPLQKFIEED